ncbi:MAG: hypothetical protein NVSMB66_6470 [Candidatus Doudnabacteria bacterium]
MKNLAIKLLAFQKEVGAIPKDSINPFYKKKYADINTYIEVVKPILSKHGLVLLQPMGAVEGRPVLETVIIDTDSGEILNTKCLIPESSDPQKMGAIITYYRRFAMQSMLCLEAEDDDGNTASDTKSPAKAVPKTTPLPVQDQNESPFGGSEVCPDCFAEMVPGKNGKLYCKPCYIKWAEANKK